MPSPSFGALDGALLTRLAPTVAAGLSPCSPKLNGRMRAPRPPGCSPSAGFSAAGFSSSGGRGIGGGAFVPERSAFKRSMRSAMPPAGFAASGSAGFCPNGLGALPAPNVLDGRGAGPTPLGRAGDISNTDSSSSSSSSSSKSSGRGSGMVDAGGAAGLLNGLGLERGSGGVALGAGIAGLSNVGGAVRSKSPRRAAGCSDVVNGDGAAGGG